MSPKEIASKFNQHVETEDFTDRNQVVGCGD